MSYDVDIFDIPTNDPDVIIEVSVLILLPSDFSFFIFLLFVDNLFSFEKEVFKKTVCMHLSFIDCF